jgi:hypothetical protein
VLVEQIPILAVKQTTNEQMDGRTEEGEGFLLL